MRGATSKKPGKRTEQSAPRPEYGRGTGVPNPIDVEVGGRIRTRRLLLGMNQQALADALDLTFQQVQKYEHGANRVSASRLAAMAKILAVPISYFFADLQSDGAELSAEDKMWREQLQRPETIQLIRPLLRHPQPGDTTPIPRDGKVSGGGRRLEPRAGPMRPSVRGQLTGWRIRPSAGESVSPVPFMAAGA
jgi:transcriptional regulator with XRE-family HTH domain